MHKIDFVVTWVDGSDPKWLAEKERYSADIDETDSMNSGARYRNVGIFQYWFRAVERYAPWVNKIYLITQGHLPSWLDTSNSKLVIVNHKDFIPEEYLPTFNSHTIELNLHRIQDLSEHFVYFNDDMFLNNDVSSHDFFVQGLPKDFGIYKIIKPIGNFSRFLLNNTIIMNKHFRNRSLIGSDFFKFFNITYGRLNIYNILSLFYPYIIGYHDNHLPRPLLKSTFDIVWEAENEILHESSKFKFRGSEDVNIYIMSHWNIETRRFAPQRRSIGRYLEVDDIKNIETILFKNQYKLICLNDTPKVKDIENVSQKLSQLFEKKYPEKSTFEK